MAIQLGLFLRRVWKTLLFKSFYSKHKGITHCTNVFRFFCCGQNCQFSKFFEISKRSALWKSVAKTSIPLCIYCALLLEMMSFWFLIASSVFLWKNLVFHFSSHLLILLRFHSSSTFTLLLLKLYKTHFHAIYPLPTNMKFFEFFGCHQNFDSF